MAYETYVGSFNLDDTKVATDTQAITGVGFQPKIVFFFYGGSYASSDTVANVDYNFGFGAAISSTSRFCVIGFGENEDTPTDTQSSNNSDCCIKFYRNAPSTDGHIDFVSMDSDGFTLVYDEAVSDDYRVSFLALGGSDLTNVFIGQGTTAASVGQYSITGVGFQPDVLITAGAFGTNIDTEQSYTRNWVGWATSSSKQGVIHLQGDDAVNPSNTCGYGYNGEINNGAITSHRDAFVSFGSDGFTLDHLEGAAAIKFAYICLKGGEYEVGELTTRTDGNDIAVNLTGEFQPVAVLFMSANRAHSTQQTKTDHIKASFGAGTSTSERACAAVWDEDNVAVSDTTAANYDSAVYAHVQDDALVALMDIKSIDSDGFTCVMDDVEASACWVSFLAIGAAAGGVTVTPGSAVALALAVDPSVLLGSTSITPGVAQALAQAIDPAVVLGSLVITPAVAEALAAGVDPSVILGSISLTPGDAQALAQALDPSVLLGSIILTPAVAEAFASTIDPTVQAGGDIFLTPALAEAFASALDPAIVMSSMSVTPAQALALALALDPNVIEGAPPGLKEWVALNLLTLGVGGRRV